jgi:hypothetical protein
VTAAEAGSLINGDLQVLVQALEAGDATAAAVATERLVTACTAARAAGVRLEAGALDTGRKLFGQCEVGAARLGERIKASLLQSAGSRRAIDSYRAG